MSVRLVCVCAIVLIRCLSAAQEVSEHRFRLEVGASHESLTNGYDPWNIYYVDGMSKSADGISLVSGFQIMERFSLNDQLLSGGVYFPLSSSVNANLDASFSPSHHTLPRWTLGCESFMKAGGGWNISANLRHASYTAIQNTRAGVGTEFYWRDERISYQVFLNATSGLDLSTAHRLQFSHFFSDISSASFTFSYGAENEALPFVVQSTVISVVLHGRQWFSRAWGMSYEIAWHEQGQHYVRKGVRLGLCRAF